jgi:soluble lytic murein transglycosylase
MIFKKFRSLSLLWGLLLALVPAAGAAAAAKDADFHLLGTFDAYRAGDPMKLAKHAQKIEGHVLTPWVEYWRLSMKLDDAHTDEVRKFFSGYGNTYVAERLRGDWLKVLGKRADWKEFDREAGDYARDDVEIRCYAWLSRLSRGDESALAEAQEMWLYPTELPPGCEKLATILWERNRIQVTDVWQRVRELFEDGQITAAKVALGYLPKAEAPDERMLAEAARQPKRLLAKLPRAMDQRATREVVVLAAARHARNDAEAVAEMLEGVLAKHLPDEDLRYLWGRVAYEGARVHHENALRWYTRADEASLDDQQLAWRVRAALRRGAWQTVREAIDRMSPDTRREAAWTYWYGRALAAQGEATGSRAYYLRIAGQTDFYGLLANEELGYVGTLPETSFTPSDADVAKAKAHPGLARALELIRLGMRTEGVREWLFAIRHFDDRQLLAAAELARREGIHDRAIHTADRTLRSHNFALRYPVPFHAVFREHAKTHNLDEAWVLGLTRQESRFVTDARSGVGAAGLMQVMPRTAKFVAKKIGMRKFRPKDVTEIDTNVSLGTGYLRIVLDQLGHPVLASAAYNAGPSRARRWRDVRPLEGAIYAETIPFSETRDYVKKVMANSVFYSAVLNKTPTPIKARLGTVPARVAGEPIEEDDIPQ